MEMVKKHVAYLAEEADELRRSFAANVFVFDYRGYGQSAGKPIESGILQDGEAALEWLCARTESTPQEVVVWGRSLGGAVAVHLAHTHGARGLVLDRTFSSMVDVAAALFPWAPVRLFLRNRYLSEEKISHYSGPLIQVHGRDDSIVPFQFGQKLHSACPSVDKQFLAVENMGHNAPWPAETAARIADFVQRLSDAPADR